MERERILKEIEENNRRLAALAATEASSSESDSDSPVIQMNNDTTQVQSAAPGSNHGSNESSESHNKSYSSVYSKGIKNLIFSNFGHICAIFAKSYA